MYLCVYEKEKRIRVFFIFIELNFIDFSKAIKSVNDILLHFYDIILNSLVFSKF